MKKRVILFAIAILLPFLLKGENKPKYVFYFIGDGMGFNHVTLAEYYNGYMNGNWGPLPISFSEFPVLGMASTFSATNLITDSAAGGTALATGHKTKWCNWSQCRLYRRVGEHSLQDSRGGI